MISSALSETRLLGSSEALEGSGEKREARYAHSTLISLIRTPPAIRIFSLFNPIALSGGLIIRSRELTKWTATMDCRSSSRKSA